MTFTNRSFGPILAMLAAALLVAGCGSGAPSDIAISQTGPEYILPGSMVVYEITVTNVGRTWASDVQVDSKTPSGMLFLYNSGACGTSFPCPLGKLPPRAVRKITTRYSIPVTYRGMTDIVHEASVSATFRTAEGGEASDPHPGNNLSKIKTPLKLEKPETRRGGLRRKRR